MPHFTEDLESPKYKESMRPRASSMESGPAVSNRVSIPKKHKSNNPQQDLSTFAMPHFDEEDAGDQKNDFDDSEPMRPRTSSTGSANKNSVGSIRSFFRKKHKANSTEVSPDSPEQLTPSRSRVKLWFDNFRPRSKSDMTAIKRVPVNGHSPHPPTITINGSDRRRQRSESGDSSLCTPMSNLMMSSSLSNTPPVHPSFTGNIFKDMFRSRANSEPKPRSRAAAIAARNKILAKQVS